MGQTFIGELPRGSGAKNGPGRLLIDALSHLRHSHHSLITDYGIPHFPTSILRPVMSTEPSTSTSHSNFVSVFNAALDTYRRETKKDLASHPLLPTLQSCDSPEAILTVLRDQISGFSESQNGDDRLTKWVTPTVNVLYAFSDTLGQGLGLVSIKVSLRGEFPL